MDGKQVAQGRITNTMRIRISFDETFDIGADTGKLVSEEYDVLFKFTGKIEKVFVNLGETKLGAPNQQKLQDMEQKARLAAE